MVATDKYNSSQSSTDKETLDQESLAYQTANDESQQHHTLQNAAQNTPDLQSGENDQTPQNAAQKDSVTLDNLTAIQVFERLLHNDPGLVQYLTGLPQSESQAILDLSNVATNDRRIIALKPGMVLNVGELLPTIRSLAVSRNENSDEPGLLRIETIDGQVFVFVIEDIEALAQLPPVLILANGQLIFVDELLEQISSHGDVAQIDWGDDVQSAIDTIIASNNILDDSSNNDGEEDEQGIYEKLLSVLNKTGTEIVETAFEQPQLAQAGIYDKLLDVLNREGTKDFNTDFDQIKTTQTTLYTDLVENLNKNGTDAFDLNVEQALLTQNKLYDQLLSTANKDRTEDIEVQIGQITPTENRLYDQLLIPLNQRENDERLQNIAGWNINDPQNIILADQNIIGALDGGNQFAPIQPDAASNQSAVNRFNPDRVAPEITTGPDNPDNNGNSQDLNRGQSANDDTSSDSSSGSDSNGPDSFDPFAGGENSDTTSGTDGTASEGGSTSFALRLGTRTPAVDPLRNTKTTHDVFITRFSGDGGQDTILGRSPDQTIFGDYGVSATENGGDARIT
ncbi:MAG: hypothetical protein AAF403_06560, partial [Pseudomonadota bacterium]